SDEGGNGGEPAHNAGIIAWRQKRRVAAGFGSVGETTPSCQPVLQQGALGWIFGEAQRANQGTAGFLITTQIAEQLRPRRVKQVIVVERVRQRLHVIEGGLRPVEVASRDGAVQLDNCRRRERQERVVWRDDLTAVGLMPA